MTILVPLLAGIAIIAWMLVYTFRGPWQRLARIYAFEGRIPVENRRRFENGRVGGGFYRGSLTVAADASGLYLGITMLPLGRKPLFVPWEDISIADGRHFGLAMKELCFRRAPLVPVQLAPETVAQLLQARGR